MALWGISTSDESKPKYLTTEEKAATFADTRGWVYRHPGGLEEILVAARNLSTSLAEATITAVNFLSTSFSEGANNVLSVEVVWNEKVTANTSGGTPYIVVTNNQAGGGDDATINLLYASGSGTNRLTFSTTYLANDGGIAEDDVLSVGAQSIQLNSGTLLDTANTAVSSNVVISSTIATAAGTLTAVA